MQTCPLCLSCILFFFPIFSVVVFLFSSFLPRLWSCMVYGDDSWEAFARLPTTSFLFPAPPNKLLGLIRLANSFRRPAVAIVVAVAVYSTHSSQELEVGSNITHCYGMVCESDSEGMTQIITIAGLISFSRDQFENRMSVLQLVLRLEGQLLLEQVVSLRSERVLGS